MSQKLQIIWVLCPLVVIVFAWGAVSWIFSIKFGKGTKEIRRRYEKSLPSETSFCQEMLPSEFFENLDSNADQNCKHPVPTEYDCSVAKHLFKSDPKTKICHELFSSVSFQLTKCDLHSKPADCWANIDIPSTQSRDYQCHVFYENNKHNNISHLLFMSSRALSMVYNLQHHLKSNPYKSHNFGLVLCYRSNSEAISEQPKDAGDFYYRLVMFEGTPVNKEEKKVQKQFVNVLMIPSLSRAGFYRFFHGSQTAMKSLQETNKAHVLDFSMYQSKDLGHLHNYFRTLMGQQDMIQTTKDSDNREKYEHFKASGFNEKDQLISESDLVLEHFMDTKCSENKVFEYFDCYSEQASGQKSFNEETATLSEDFRDFVCKLSSVEILIQPLSSLSSLSKSCSEKWLISSIVIKLQFLFTQYILRSRKRTQGKQDTTFNVGLATNVFRTPFERDIKHSFDAVDLSLSDHIYNIGQLSNTVTFILSERGFVHPTYSKMSSYGRIEQENPIFFMILPNWFIRNKPSSQFMSLLHEHRSRLLNIENIHKILQTTIQMLAIVHKDGSFISPGTNKSQPLEQTSDKNGLQMENDRDSMLWYFQLLEAQTCTSLGIKQPNLCLCEGESIDFSNDTVQVGTAEFAIGEMNKLLRRAINSIVSSEIFTHSPYGYCSKLQGIVFKNVQITHMNNCIRTKLEIYVMLEQRRNISEDQRSQYEKFHVIVDRLYENNASVLKLIDYKRIPSRSSPTDDSNKCNSLGLYEDSLCICDNSKHKYTFSKSDMLKQLSHKQFGMTPLLINVHGTCLFLVIRHYRHSAAFEAANACEGRIYEFTLHYHTKGMVLSGDQHVKVTLHGMEENFMGVAVQVSYHKQDAHVWYTTTVSYRDI